MILISGSWIPGEICTCQDDLMLSCTGLRKNFKNGKSLVFPDFELKAAEELLILGPSGCGKTTLLNILAGLLKPDAGLMTFLGVDFHALSASEMDHFRGKHIGLCLQKPVFIRALSVVDNLLLSQRLAGVDQNRSEAIGLLKELNLESTANQSTESLSAGERQRLMFIRALINHPKLILADEPTSALDDYNAQVLIEMLKSHCAQHGAALIVVTHDQRVKSHFNQMIILS
ncbi:MAG: ATP-binding cassette domain-containing protein [Saprospiraceae bacterium]|mgnify:CR=1 FL=1